ncbi:MAG TPA: hypothetical protein PK867_08890, partial [Pirellulales bacterium]|nr:hypothetical protein [Pirellulales bacterium]
GSTAFGPAVTTVSSVNAQTYNDAVTLGAGATTFVSTANAALTFGGTVTGSGNDLAVTSNGTTTFDGKVSVKSLTATSTSGTITFDGNVILSGATGLDVSGSKIDVQAITITTTAAAAPVDFNGPVVLTGAATIDTQIGNGTITFANTLESDAVATPRDLMLIAGPGNITFVGAVGTTPLGKIAISSANNVTAKSTLAADSFKQVAGSGTTTFDAAVTVSGATGVAITTTAIDLQASIGATAAAAPVTLNAPVTLTGDVAITTNGGDMSFSGTVDGAHALTLSPGSGNVLFGGNVGATTPLTSLTVNGAGTTTVDANVTTTGSQAYQEAVKLAATPIAPAITLVQSLVTTDSDVTFAQTVDAAAAGVQGLSLSVGSGDVKFGNNLGATAALASLSVNGTGTTTLLGNVATTGSESYNEAAVIAGLLTLTTTNADVTFSQTVDGITVPADSLTISVGTGNVNLDKDVGGAKPLADLTINGSGTTTLNGNVNTAGKQLYHEAVKLGATLSNYTLNSAVGSGANIEFFNTVDATAAGGQGLTITAGSGNINFDTSVGAVAPLSSLAVKAAAPPVTSGTTTLSGSAAGSVITTGSQTYGESVVLARDTNLQTTTNNANVTFSSTVDALNLGGAALTIDTSGGRAFGNFGVVRFEGKVGNLHPLAALTITSGPFTLNSGINVTTTGNVLITVAEEQPNEAGGPKDNLELSGGSTLTSSGGNIELRAGDNLKFDAGSSVAATAGTVTLRADFNNNDTTPGATIDLDGAINSPTINVFSGDGNDTINLQQTLAGTTTNINANGGGDTVNISSTAGGSGAGVVSGIAGTVNVAAAGANNTLNLDDGGDATGNSGTLTATGITGLGMAGTVNYSGLAQVNVNLGTNAALDFKVQSTLGTTPVNLKGQASGTVDVGDLGNRLDGIAGLLVVDKVKTLDLNDQGSTSGQVYNIDNMSIGRPLNAPHVLVEYLDMGAGTTVQVNGGNQLGSQLVDDTFNLLLPTINDQPL